MNVDIPRIQFGENGWFLTVQEFEGVTLEIVVDEKLGILLHSREVARACRMTASGIRQQKIKQVNKYLEGDHWIITDKFTERPRRKTVYWTLKGVKALSSNIKNRERGVLLSKWLENLSSIREEEHLTDSKQHHQKRSHLVPVEGNWTRLIEEVQEFPVDIFYIDDRRNIMAFGTDLCRFAGYSEPHSKAGKVYRSNKVFFSKLSGMSKTDTPSGDQKSRYYINEGIHFFIMELDTPQAKILKIAYARIVEKFRKGELVAANRTGLLLTEDDIKKIARKEALEVYRELHPGKTISTGTVPLTRFISGETGPANRFVTRDQRRVLNELVAEVVRCFVAIKGLPLDPGDYYREAWLIHNNRFTISSVNDLPAAKYSESKDFLFKVISRLRSQIVQENQEGTVAT
ncbi:MAG: Bro-N domain-containing protein [Candidatus Odinarchaeota archaeon]